MKMFLKVYENCFMNIVHFPLKSSILVLISTFSLLTAQQKSISSNSYEGRARLLMDFGWRFAFGHVYDVKRDFNHNTGYFSYITKTGFGDGAAAKDFDDRAWRMLNLPHDWAVELPFDLKASSSHGFKTIGRNYPETSIGWYRKTFSVPASDLGKRISIEFDGVHRNSVVWVNGFYLGEQHSGYYGFRYDVTDYLNYGSENVVAVRVDATMEEGWYYEGAGIYRHVWLNKTAPLHIAPNGIFVSSGVKNISAEITASVIITNEGTKNVQYNIEQIIVDKNGSAIANGKKKRIVARPGETNEYSTLIQLPHPELWSIETPYLYLLITSVYSEGSLVDRCKTMFGVRTLRFDSKEGFFLNGKHLLLKGTNNHQDHAGVGTAIPDALQEFRVKRLKEMGSNAYRCSHNPPTPELLDACDRLGMLVIVENRLMGTNAEHLDQLRQMIMRDRNHPSVFIWSLGNEEWAIEGNITGARVASTMQDFVQKIDPTRRVTYAHSGWGEKGISTVQDVMGYNYIFNGDIDKQHERFPNQPSMGTEETTSRSTRGVYFDDSLNAYLAPIDRKPPEHGVEEGLKFYAARPFLSGLFFWTGFDYRGEPHPYGWPQVSSQSGIVDLCGFPKDMFYYLKSWWTDEPVLHIFPHWNWKGKEGDTIQVWAYSNCDEVELFLNTRSLGRKRMQKNSHLEWPIVYEPGILNARGYKIGKDVISYQIATTNEPAQIKLTTNRSLVQANGEDISVVTVQINDSEGRLVPTASNEIQFDISGPVKIIGIGNGNPSSHEPDKYFEHVSQISIMNLKTKTVDKKDHYSETGWEYNDSAWVSVLGDQGEYNIQAIDTQKAAIIRGNFILNTFADGTKISLWPKSLGEKQSIYINGYLVAKDVKRDDQVQEYKLDHTILRKGRNVYAIVAAPLRKRYQYDNLNTDPGIIQVSQPPQPWKRKVFNGLAQLILQATKEAGEILVTASSDGLSQGEIRIQSQSAVLSPAVPAE
jgi:beta-galactosidase